MTVVIERGFLQIGHSKFTLAANHVSGSVFPKEGNYFYGYVIKKF
jgi:hypothetical protein